MKKFAKILGVFLLLGGIGGGLAFYFTAELPKVAERFFLLAKEGKLDEAEQYLSPQFKQTVSSDELRDYLRAKRLDTYEDSSWGNRSISGSQGELKGKINTSAGDIPVNITFFKNQGSWQIQNITVPQSGVDSHGSRLQVPSEATLEALVRETMFKFADAINSKSMQSLHDFASDPFRQQHNVEALEQAFSTFYTDADFRSLLSNPPTMAAPPRIDEGVLILESEYLTELYRTSSTLKYVMEGSSWKLYGINLGIVAVKNSAENTAAQESSE